MIPHNVSAIRHSSRMIMVADGVYTGRQKDTQLGQNDCVIGYRHRGDLGPNTLAYVGFADGHVEGINSNQFPQGQLSTNPNAATENLSGPTLYENPEQIFQ
jgi:prepilin-type processing-associated H-X9-DG protein